MKENILTTEDSISFDSEISESQLELIDKSEVFRIEVNDGLQAAFDELESLKNEFNGSEGDMLIEQCKQSVVETITGQFGIASLLIDSRDGGSSTTAHNFEKGITSSEADQKKYDAFTENQNRDWHDVRKETGYDKPLPQKRKEAFKSQNTIKDEYTGKSLSKDGRAHLDHVVSAKEIESKAKNNLYLSPEERAKMATEDSNLAWTEGSANQSKSDKKMDEWLKEKDKKTGEAKADKYGIDEEMALKRDREARKAIDKKINTEAFKKHSNELLISGGKDAAKMAAYSALGVVMREFTQEIFAAIKETFANRGTESMKEIFIRFKQRMHDVMERLKEKWKDILKNSIEGGLTAFFSNILVFVINLFATTLKKVVSMIRAGFVSLVQAIKVIINPPEGMSSEEARYQAVKIMTAGLIGAASLGLSACIEKLLQAIPGLQPLMMFPIPSFGGEPRTVSDIIAVTLSALLGGLLTTVTLYFMDKFRQDGRKTKLRIQLVYQSGLVVDYKVAQTWFVLKDAYAFLEKEATETAQKIIQTKNAIEESCAEATSSSDDFTAALARLKRA